MSGFFKNRSVSCYPLKRRGKVIGAAKKSAILQICFSPDLPKTISKNIQITSHDGIFHILENDVPNYIEEYNPKILRFSKAINTMNLPALNIGLSKGRTYERVLIFPTKPMIKYLKSLDISEAGDKEKLYIAITRAKYSAAFVVPNDPNNQTTIRWMHGTPS